MIDMNMTTVAIQILLKMMHSPNNTKSFHLSSSVVALMGLQCSISIGYGSYTSISLFLGEDDTKPESGSVCLQAKITGNIGKNENWRFS